MNRDSTMNVQSGLLRAKLALRIRTAAPADWGEFSRLWMAFNAIYGGEPDQRERSRVMAVIRKHMNARQALAVLRQITRSVDRLLEVPPGNMLLEHEDPNFRATAQRYAAIYRNKKERSVSRLAAVAAILYQVRCNLIHGSKDPYVERDRLLVTESLAILNILVPALEQACLAAA